MHRRAFTLIEICLAVLIIALLITLAVPSIKGVLEQGKSKETFDRFDSLVHQAQGLAMSERRAYVISWDKAGLSLHPGQLSAGDDAHAVARIDTGKEECYQIEFPAALVKKPAAEWMFWPSGTCESARITYQGNSGTWVVDYDPFTVRATFSSNEK